MQAQGRRVWLKWRSPPLVERGRDEVPCHVLPVMLMAYPPFLCIIIQPKLSECWLKLLLLLVKLAALFLSIPLIQRFPVRILPSVLNFFISLSSIILNLFMHEKISESFQISYSYMELTGIYYYSIAMMWYFDIYVELSSENFKKLYIKFKNYNIFIFIFILNQVMMWYDIRMLRHYALTKFKCMDPIRKCTKFRD